MVVLKVAKLQTLRMVLVRGAHSADKLLKQPHFQGSELVASVDTRNQNSRGEWTCDGFVLMLLTATYDRLKETIVALSRNK